MHHQQQDRPPSAGSQPCTNHTRSECTHTPNDAHHPSQHPPRLPAHPGGTRGEAMGHGGSCWFGRKPCRGEVRRASACKAPSGSAPAMPAVPGLCSSTRASSPGGSARLTAWRLFIRRQRQRELLADAGAFVLQGSLLPSSQADPDLLQPLFLPSHPNQCTMQTQGSTVGIPAPKLTVAWKDLSQGPSITQGSGGGTQRCPRAGGGWAANTELCHSAPFQAGWGAPPKHGPLARYQEKRWQPVLAQGQAREGGCPPAPRGREQSPGISVLAGPGCPPLCTPPSSSRARARGYN